MLFAGCGAALSLACTLPSQGIPPVAVTDDDFDRVVLESKTPVMVDFYADWCGPCKQLAPVVSEVAADYKGRVVVAKLDVDASPKIAIRYGITSIPAVLYFKDGELQRQLTGVQSKEVLSGVLDDLLKSSTSAEAASARGERR